MPPRRASAIPRNGGGYAYVREAFPAAVSFVMGWTRWFTYMIAGSLYALGFSSNFVEFAPGEEYEQFVDGTIFPESFGARAAANEITGGGVRSVEEIGGDTELEIVDVEVSEDAPAAGRRLDEIQLPLGSLIIAESAGGRIGGPDTVLEPGARYLVAVESDVADEVMNPVRG